MFAREYLPLRLGSSKADLEAKDLRASKARVYLGGNTKRCGLGEGSQAKMGSKPDR